MSNEKIRIFCVITQGELGGAQQFVAQLAQHLDQERFDLHIVWGSDGSSAIARHLPSYVTHAIASHLVRRVAPLEDLRAIRQLRVMMTQWKPDIVLCISSKAGFLGSRAAHGLRGQFPGLQVIYRIGGWTFNDPWPAWKKKIYLWMEKLSARWKDVIVVNNTHDLRQAKAMGIEPRDSILRIYNGIDPYLEFLPRDEARAALATRIPERYRTTPYDYLVGTIANLYPAKDIPTLIQAAAQVSDNIRFVVIGDGQLRAELQEQIDQCGLKDRFFILGTIPHAYAYLNALDAFVLPSVKEGFPWSVLEAMAAKVPVIATRVGAVPEILEDHVSGIIVEPGQTNQMAGAIVELLESDRLRRELAIQAHQQVISRFSLREMIAQYEKLFSADGTSR